MIDKSRKVHLCFLNSYKQRSWFVKTDRRFDRKTGQSTTWPFVSDDPHDSVSITYEYAEISRRLWRDEPFNLNVRIALEPNQSAEFVDPDPKVDSLPWEHEDYFITTDETGQPSDSVDAPFGYNVKAVHTVNGAMFCLRFETPILQNQSQFSTFQEGPTVAVLRALERGFCKVERPKPNPHIEAKRREAERQTQQARVPRLRPGDM